MTQAAGQHGHYHPVVVFSAFYGIGSEETYGERVDTSKHSMNPGSHPKRRDILLLEAFLQTYLKRRQKRGVNHLPSPCQQTGSSQTAPLIDVYTAQYSQASYSS